jgi:predicted nucleic acid-binding protein
LSAIIGGRARLALTHPQVAEVFTTEHPFAEVEEYASILAKKKHLSSDTVLLTLAALPVTLVSRTKYARRLAEAAKLIGHRDPEDIDLLALALHFRIPVWTNDKDFEKLNLDLFTTEQLFRYLAIID